MINRREFFQRAECALLTTGAVLAGARISVAEARHKPISIGLGPQLFLDDYVIESTEGVQRVVHQPERLPKPVLDNKTFGTTQPYMTVLRDSATNRFRIWYNNQAALWHAESDDGIRWRNPQKVWDTSHCFGASLVDDGPSAPNPQRRYKLANWQATRIREDKPGDDGGMWVAFSPDGLRWTAYEKNPVLPTWPEGYGKIVPHATQDIIDVFYDPVEKIYRAAVKTPAVPEDKLARGPRAGQSIRRLVGMSTCRDFIHWEKPWRILTPGGLDDGLIEFYGMGGIHKRGNLYIGLVRVLHDDYGCDPGGPKNGIGYTQLACSRDGKTWERLGKPLEPFLDRNQEPGSWDHAMAWMGYTLPLDDEVYFYYGGYARGHKIEPQKERQIGLARMKRDRYVAFESINGECRLTTRLIHLPNGRLTINADTRRGHVRVRPLDANGKPLFSNNNGFSPPITGDVLAAEVRLPLQKFRGQPVQLEFGVLDASLFGFEFHRDQA